MLRMMELAAVAAVEVVLQYLQENMSDEKSFLWNNQIAIYPSDCGK